MASEEYKFVIYCPLLEKLLVRGFPYVAGCSGPPFLVHGRLTDKIDEAESFKSRGAAKRFINKLNRHHGRWTQMIGYMRVQSLDEIMIEEVMIA